MHDAGFRRAVLPQAISLEQSQHAPIVAEHVEFEFVDAVGACQSDQSTDQQLAEPAALISIHYGAGEIGAPLAGHDVLREADDLFGARFAHGSDQGGLTIAVKVDEAGELALGHGPPRTEEPKMR